MIDYSDTQTSFVGGWVIDLVFLAIITVGLWLLIDGTREDSRFDNADPWTHEFDPALLVGEGWVCTQMMEDGDLCLLTEDEHRTVYGEEHEDA